jgi:hypothetical protein
MLRLNHQNPYLERLPQQCCLAVMNLEASYLLYQSNFPTYVLSNKHTHRL